MENIDLMAVVFKGFDAFSIKTLNFIRNGSHASKYIQNQIYDIDCADFRQIQVSEFKRLLMKYINKSYM